MLGQGGIEMTTRYFDLNVEQVLENWEVHHAIREVIANALDEQMLTSTREIEIHKDSAGRWHIRDHGRGVRIAHFTLNENKEKLQSRLPVIGKFGVGLKDALATFYRREIDVIIRSSFGCFKLKKAGKSGFDDIQTLHVEFEQADQQLDGTDVMLVGVSDDQMALAKSLFLGFSNETILDSNDHGQILDRRVGIARVYILGVLAAEEPNFLFSYNITSLTGAMKKRLNRERLNVGRSTYADRIKVILRTAVAERVKTALVEQVMKRGTGDQSDEMGWIEISQHALNLMHQTRPVAYVTESELQTQPGLIGSAKSDGLEIVVISDRQKAKLEDQASSGGSELRTLDVYRQVYNQSFVYDFVERRDLSSQERKVFDLTARLLSFVGIVGRSAPDVRISQTTRITSTDTSGVWDSSLRAIVIRRSALASLPEYAGTLLHEAAHAQTGAPDVSRDFEGVLTRYMGRLAEIAVER